MLSQIYNNIILFCYYKQLKYKLYLLLFSHQVISDTLWSHGLQHASLPCTSLSPQFGQTLVNCVNISSFVTRFPCPQSFLASGSSPMRWLFASCGQSIGASATVLPMNIQGWFPLGYWLVWSPCYPRDFHEPSPALQFENINSLALNLLYGPTFTSAHDYWKKA